MCKPSKPDEFRTTRSCNYTYPNSPRFQVYRHIGCGLVGEVEDLTLRNRFVVIVYQDHQAREHEFSGTQGDSNGKA